MAEDKEMPLRSWQEIAEAASKERDPEKLLKLTHELERALDKREEELAKRKSAGTVHGLASDMQRASSTCKRA